MVITRQISKEYNVRAELHKVKYSSDGTSIYYDINIDKVFWAKNKNFQTAILNDNGRQESVTTGEIETIYLFKGDIQPEDQIYINGEMFIVTNVTFQANIEKKISKRLQQLGTTLISLRN